MELVLGKITQKNLKELRRILRNDMMEDRNNEMILNENYIEAFLVLLLLIKSGDRGVIDALTATGIIKERDIPLDRVEKGIRTIAAEDYINKLLNPDAPPKPRWAMTKLKVFTTGVAGENDARGAYWVTRTYKKFQTMFRDRQNRVKKSPKVKELADAYPDVNVYDLVALGMLRDKIDLTYEDMTWLDEMIRLLRVKG